MRLLNTDIQEKVIIKLDRSIRIVDEGVDGIMAFGEKNDYPETIEQIINNSKTAKAVSKIHTNFLVGQGFENESINSIVVSKDNRYKDVTVKDLLIKVSQSLSNFNGFYLKTVFNLAGEIAQVYFEPFKFFRFAKPDSLGYSAKVCWNQNWAERYNQKNIVPYPIYNDNPEVLKSKIKIDEKGQPIGIEPMIFFSFLDNEYFYPLSPFDSCYLDCDSEYQVSLFMNSATRNGMLKKTIIRVPMQSDEKEQRKLDNAIDSFIGVDGSNVLKIMDDFANMDKELFKVDQLESNIDSTLFDTWHKTLANNIRKTKNVPAILLDYEESKLGTTSGEAIIQAVNFMNETTKMERAFVEQNFKQIFSKSVIPELKNNQNWKIRELLLYPKQNEPTTNI